jgi:hypothetical protein
VSEAAASSELMERVALLEGLRQQLEKARKQAETERDEYKHLYVTLLEHVRKLEAGLVGQKRERHGPASEQLTLEVVSTLVTDAAVELTPAPTTTVERHERAKPTGRKPLPPRRASRPS